MRVFHTIVVFLFSLSALASTAGAQGMYWSDWNGQINTATINGTNRQTLISGLQNPNGVALDVPAGKIYWTDVASQKVQRANLDGTNIEDLITTSTYQPRGIALDLAASKMYWVDGGNDGGQPARVERANLDGSGRETLLSQSYAVAGLFDIALDLVHSKMYVTDFQSNRIERANLDGSGVTDVLTGLDDPWGVALDVAGNKMYWADAGTLYRASMDGGPKETLFSRGSEGLGGVALDLYAGKVYWINGADSLIQRANLDGSSVENVVTGAQFNRFIALNVPEPTSAFALGFSGYIMLWRRARV